MTAALPPPHEELCQVAENIAHSFLPIAICKASVAVIGLVASTYTFLNEGLKWLVHPNAKVIFFNHALLTVISAIVYFCEYSFEVYRIVFPSPGPCGYILNGHTAFWVRMPLNLLICLQSSNMFIFVIERAIATRWPEEYERLNRPKDAIIACGVVTIFGIMYTLALLAFPNRYNYWSTAVTVKTPENYYTLWLVSIAMIEVVSNCILVGSTIATLKKRNNFRKHKRSQLGSKYQVNENRNILLLLLPCFSLHSLFQLLTAGGIVGYNTVAKTFDPATSAMVAEIFNQFLLYTIIIPVVMFVQKKFFKRQNVVDSQLKTDDYFKQLHGLWK